MASVLSYLPNMALIAFGIALLICSNAMPIGIRLGVLDHPDASRKLHHLPTPLVGGVAILLPVLVWCLVELAIGNLDHTLLIAMLLCGLGVGFVGFADDQSDTTPLSRTVTLALFMAIALALDSRLISPSIHWSATLATAILPWIYCMLVTVSVIGLVNSVNMADGQNGISLSMFATWSGCLALLGDHTVSAVAVVLLITALCVLTFNLRGKLFLGDTGSYGVSFMIGLLAVQTHALDRISIPTLAVWFFIPMADCLRLIVSRALRGNSPFKGDRDHLHHHLQSRFGANLGLVIYAGTVSSSSILASLFPAASLPCLAVLAVIYFLFARLHIEPSAAQATQPDESNLIVLDKNQTRLQA